MPEDSWMFTIGGTFTLAADDRRRRCEKEPPREEEKEGFRDARTRTAYQKVLRPSGDSN